MLMDNTIAGGYGEDSARTDKERQEVQLAALGNTLKILRDEAVEGRAASGIEAEWLEDEEYYEGIDDANREGRAIKPTSPDGRVRIERPKEKKTSRSNVFVNITRPYVNAASAKMADMLFPTDDKNYAMRPTPIPDLIQKSKDNAPAVDATGNPVIKTLLDDEGQPAQVPQMGADGQQTVGVVRKQATNADVAKEEMKRAKEACEKAKGQIEDWLVECGYHGEGRQVIEDSARIGTGVLKGPFPENVRRRAVVRALKGIGMVIKDEIRPKSKRISAWNLYPDPSCGESIHNGKYVWEYDEINSRQLQELKRDPSYLADAISEVIKEGPKNRATGLSRRKKDNKPNDKEFYEIWYYTGYLSRKDLEAAGYEFDGQPEVESATEDAGEIGGLIGAGVEDYAEGAERAEMPEQAECGCDDNEQFPALVVMVNDVVIKATQQPLDSGEFPYDVMPWQRRSGHWAGIGIGRQMRTSQDGVNAATRNMMDNAGVSGSPILIVDRSKVIPADGRWELGTRKVYYTAEGVEITNIRDAFTWIIAPSMQAELMNIIQFWMQRAEDETGLPMLLQGQQGKAPDTVGGMTILNNNGSAVLRRIARIFDDLITEPHIGRYYEWLLMHGDDDSMKGDFTIDARGSSALIERDMQSQVLMQMLGSSVNPAFGLDPEMVMAEFLKSQRFDAEKLKLSDEKKAEMAQQQQQPQDPRIQVAQMKIEADQKVLQAEQAFEAKEADLSRQNELVIASINERMASTQLTSEERQHLDSIKSTLAQTSAKLAVQKDLSLAAHTVDLHKRRQVIAPPTEPQGKAAPGMAFSA